LILRKYKEGDEVFIMHLFYQCFDRAIPESFWRWRFVENPNDKIFIYLAWDEKNLVAHYAVSPIKISMEGFEYCTGLSMSTMTHPKYRGLKLFPQLANLVYEEMASLNYLMVWGFPNNKSHKSFIRDLYWKTIYEIPTMQKHLSNIKRENADHIITDNHFDLNYNEDYLSSDLIHVKKDKRYLKWRYSAHPLNHYTNLVLTTDNLVSSFCIIKKYMNSLDIIDFQAKNKAEGSELLNQALAYAYENKMESVNCWAPCHHFLHSIFEEKGFINKEPITYFGFKKLQEGIPKRLTDNFASWFIQMGDSDVY
jgi:hypothetical protein